MEVIVNRVRDKHIFDIVPLKLKRDWMSDSKNSFAYRCLPLNIANQYGWAVLSPLDFSIVSNGGKNPKDIQIEVDVNDEDLQKTVLSYFGESVFTLHLDFIIKTPENYSLYVRGVTNINKDGILPLDAIIETDWLPYVFTYNFMVTKPGTYKFKKGEPLFIFFPIERNTVENFKLIDQDIKEDEEFYDEHLKFREHHRSKFPPKKPPRYYFNGIIPNKNKEIKNHKTKISFNHIINKDIK